ncbi:site-2 protease family protein [Longispora sp. K20-0274]|uniref:site-2 protease family protein n=1 Tax=Longispora sp. K20-0274 TaxID=3088255 RepID=UPI00399C28F9
MRQTLRLGRVAGIAVGMHWSVLLVGFLLIEILPATAPDASAAATWSVAVAAAVAFLASLLAHELAHALVAHRYRMRVEKVTLWLLGGVAELTDTPPSPRAELAVSAAGPATSVAAGIGFGAAALLGTTAGLPEVVVAALVWLGVVNVILAVFNLLPGAPLDGGRVLHAALWWRTGDPAAAQVVATRIGHGLGLVMVGVGLAQVVFTGTLGGLWLALVGWFLMSAATAERHGAVYAGGLTGRLARDVMTADPVCGHADQTVIAFATTVAAAHRHRCYPVLDDAGRPVGLVSLTGLRGVPLSSRLADVSTPPRIVGPAAPAIDLLAQVAQGPVLVVDDGQLIGLVTATDLTRAVELAALTATEQRTHHERR